MNEITEQPIDHIRKRRELIRTEPAPHPRHDAIVTLSGEFIGKKLRLRYIPDRDVVLTSCLETYLDALSTHSDGTLETITQMILEDFNDQAIPSWLEVTLTEDAGNFAHQVRIEDRQPHWKDRGLLDRLDP